MLFCRLGNGKDGPTHWILNVWVLRGTPWNLKNIYFIHFIKWHKRSHPQMLLLSKTGGVKLCKFMDDRYIWIKKCSDCLSTCFLIFFKKGPAIMELFSWGSTKLNDISSVYCYFFMVKLFNFWGSFMPICCIHFVFHTLPYS